MFSSAGERCYSGELARSVSIKPVTTDEEVGKTADGAKGTTTRDEPRVAA